MPNATEKQISYILQLANKLTGEKARYPSQSSVLPSAIKSGAEASGWINDLQAAIEAEKKRKAATGIAAGAKIRCTYARKDGTHGRLSGTVRSLHWSGTQANGVYLDDLDASWEVTGSWFYLDRMSEVSTGDDPQALKAERERLLARIAEIDAILAAK